MAHTEKRDKDGCAAEQAREFSRRLADLMSERGLTQNGLADELTRVMGRRVYASAVNGWLPREGDDEADGEGGERKPPSLPGGAYMLALPEALDVSGHWLLTGNPPIRPADPEKADLALGWIQAFARWATATGESEAVDAQRAVEAAEAFLSWARNGGVADTG